MPNNVTTTWTDDELSRAVQETLRRISTDEEFKKLAVADGAAAIARVNPKPLPEGLVMKFVDNSGHVKTIPLPTPTFEEHTIQNEEITDAELESVAGGVSVSGGVSVNIGVVSISIGVSS